MHGPHEGIAAPCTGQLVDASEAGSVGGTENAPPPVGCGGSMGRASPAQRGDELGASRGARGSEWCGIAAALGIGVMGGIGIGSAARTYSKKGGGIGAAGIASCGAGVGAADARTSSWRRNAVAGRQSALNAAAWARHGGRFRAPDPTGSLPFAINRDVKNRAYPSMQMETTNIGNAINTLEITDGGTTLWSTRIVRPSDIDVMTRPMSPEFDVQ